ncbi:30S ribosomal protein S6 [candidate division WWE3 bacterium RIFOXYC1_FULL_40_10]|uniref:Small ribosomal subunit protein bS6 n=1 Tax=candidate division WWE3 bacterium RIFOXYA2_FULL_46_9 TaxID=1802636 RepID=A0A1F4W1S3_UNCKA|nr:MAG: 30S ribosomal protein S6 [candidate division WWE3 bacterium RIFOXYB1_FULL_40_22]OGC61431.1 MAG: 30S ribosomal protein S6 [candidate division WWE3 bacterium RIFOXYA1_FULL_40_11]OGC63364.1 MAG: 30S ribosomal protein S6 [candidate division WWE3 bacterium RIFOXYA2_FULL_46_9]OGC65430.1 MAG: 30S ribosomal protein S6 [candidate division WWE3 bacterium RIFOXYB2_FULL_41_6]OGC65814.1 MAG: 30S ribosomal protein S6 [candidate division WWE3 bacterium RIFOXYC1_FULL_40_10]OGC67351.1 MAG: 30S ribosoma
MKKYELMLIANIDLGEQGAKDFFVSVKDMIQKMEGAIVREDYWGKRKFAYEIKGKSEGFYSVLEVTLESASLADLKTKLNRTSGVVRYLITALAK